MSLTTRQTFQSIRSYVEVLIPSLTMFAFLVFALLMGLMIVVSMIPLYLSNQSVPKTIFIRTTVRLTNYSLSMSRSLGKRDVQQSQNLTQISTLAQGLSIMNTSIQSALEQQLKQGDFADEFYMIIFKIVVNSNNPNNMSALLDFLIVYTKECRSCDRHRQSIISQQLCSNNQLTSSVYFLIQNTNQSYSLSQPLTVYTSYISIQNIVVITQVVSLTQSTNPIKTNQTQSFSNTILVNNYSLIVTTTRTNYLAILNEVITGNSAMQNAGPVSLVGSSTMYSQLIQIIGNQVQSSNSSIVSNLTINYVLLNFWYMNSTVGMVIDFLITYSTICNTQCASQLQYQLTNLTNAQIYIQPANSSAGQVYLSVNGSSMLYSYSWTTQVISNFSGTITSATSPLLTYIY